MNNATSTIEMQETNYAEQQAIAQVQPIVELMAAYNCDFDRLEELRDERSDWLDENTNDTAMWALANPDDAEELDELEAQAGEYESKDDAEEALNSDPLSIETRSAWTCVGDSDGLQPAEYRIVLCTGGPHVELVGDLDTNGEPTRVRVLYSDWGCHGELFDFDHCALLEYAQHFIYN
jgi:hypothetical protein